MKPTMQELIQARELLREMDTNGEFEAADGCVFTQYNKGDDPMDGCLMEPSRRVYENDALMDPAPYATADFAALAMNILVRMATE